MPLLCADNWALLLLSVLRVLLIMAREKVGMVSWHGFSIVCHSSCQLFYILKLSVVFSLFGFAYLYMCLSE